MFALLLLLLQTKLLLRAPRRLASAVWGCVLLLLGSFRAFAAALLIARDACTPLTGTAAERDKLQWARQQRVRPFCISFSQLLSYSFSLSFIAFFLLSFTSNGLLFFILAFLFVYLSLHLLLVSGFVPPPPRLLCLLFVFYVFIVAVTYQ